MDVSELVQSVAATRGTACFFLSFILFFAWMVWNGSRHVRPGGRLRRGVPVWRRALDPTLVPALSLLPEQLERDWGWARRDGDLLLLRVDQNKIGEGTLRTRTSWPYVALIQLDWDAPRISYRQPLGTTLFVLPHLLAFFPFVLGMAFINHRMQAPAIDAALAELATGSGG